MEQGALVLTPAGDIFYCNRGFENMVRMRLDEIVGLPMTEFLAGSDESESRAAARGGRGNDRDRAAGVRWNRGAGLHQCGPVRRDADARLPGGDRL